MDARPYLGLLGTIVIAATAALGIWAFATNYGVDPTDPTLLAPTLGALIVAGLFVLVLSSIGSRGGGWLDTAYW